MEQRWIKIFYYLLQQTNGVTIDFLSQKYEVSTRTIRYDLDKIDNLLSDNALPILKRLGRCGIKLSSDIPEYHEKVALLNLNICNSYLFSQEERILLIQLKLLLNSNIQTIDSLRIFFDVSKSTMVSDMKIIKQQLHSLDIEIQSLPGYGTFIDVPERKRRTVALQVLFELISVKNFISILEALSTQKTNHFLQYFNSLLTRKELTIAYRIAISLEEHLKVTWCDKSFLQIVCILAINKNRSFFSSELTFTEYEEKVIANTRDYWVVTSKLYSINKLYGWPVETNDMIFLTYYILCSQTLSSSYYFKKNHVYLQLNVSKFIKEAEKIYQKTLYQKNFLHRIMCEFCSRAFYRIIFNHDYRCNKATFHPEFERLQPCLEILENWIGGSIPPEELKNIYTLLILGFSSEVSEDKKRKFNAILITEGDTISAYKLSMQINENFSDIAIAAIKPRHNPQKLYALDDIDFIISTSPLPLIGIPTINIDKSLSEHSIIEIRKFLSNNIFPDRTQTHQTSDTINRMLYIAKECCPTEVYKMLFNQWCYELNLWNKFLPSLTTEITLSHLIPRNRIQLNVSAHDWQDAVNIAGNLLVGDNCVHPQYVAAMLTSCKENGFSSTMIAQGCALPHARFCDGVKQLSMSLITLKEPIFFGSSDYNPISVIFCLAPVDDCSHLEALRKILSIITDEKKYQQLYKNSDVNSVWELLV